jgi:S-adenosylmethionine hydrolase
LEEFGPPLRSFKRFKISKPRFFKDSIVGHVLSIDKFGNYITDIPSEMVSKLLESERKGEPVLRLGKAVTTSFRKTFASSKKGELFYLPGSLGTIEIARREASAYAALKVKPGARVEISLKSRRT